MPADPPYDAAARNTSDASRCVGGESGPRATIAPGLSPGQATAQVSHWVEGSDVPTGRGWAACARIRTSQTRPALEFETPSHAPTQVIPVHPGTTVPGST